jgi:hypothetical protein
MLRHIQGRIDQVHVGNTLIAPLHRQPALDSRALLSVISIRSLLHRRVYGRTVNTRWLGHFSRYRIRRARYSVWVACQSPMREEAIG